MSSQLSLESINTLFIKNQLPETFGLKIVEVNDNSIVGELEVDHRHLRPGRIMNGGVSLVLIETIGSISSCLFIDPENYNTFGIQVTANHISVAREGDILKARSVAVHIGKTTQVWDVEITNQNNKKISSGRITMLVTTTALNKV